MVLAAGVPSYRNRGRSRKWAETAVAARPAAATGIRDRGTAAAAQARRRLSRTRAHRRLATALGRQRRGDLESSGKRLQSVPLRFGARGAHAEVSAGW